MIASPLSNSLALSPLVSTESLQSQEAETSIAAARSVRLGSVGLMALAGLLGSTSQAQAAVRSGARCHAVHQLQTALAERGYAVGAIDGVFGRKTERAVRQFQQAQKLMADGIVGPMTAKAMGLSPEFSCSMTVASQDKANVLQNAAGQNAVYRVATHGGDLRLRRSPAGRIIGALKPNRQVTVVGASQGWAKLSSGAWVSQTWLRPVSSLAQSSPSQPPVAQLQHSSEEHGSGQRQQAAQAVREEEVDMIQAITSSRPRDSRPEIFIDNALPSKAGEDAQVGKDGQVIESQPVASVQSQTATPQPEKSTKRVERWRPAAYDVIIMPKPEFAVPAATKAGAITVNPPADSSVLAANPPVNSSISPAFSQNSQEPVLQEIPLQESPLQETVVQDEAVAVGILGSMQVVTHGNRLLIRSEPRGEIIGSVPNGIQLNIVREKDGWYELDTGGWVLGRWLRS